MIAEGYKANFDTLCRAVRANDVCIMECTDVVTGKPVIVVCAVQRAQGAKGEIEMVPMAKLFDGNPYEELMPPELDNPPSPRASDINQQQSTKE